MKKLFLIVCIGTFFACNDSVTSTVNTLDSTGDVKVDSLEAVSDSTAAAVNSSSMVDSMHVKSDSMKK